MCPIRWDSRFFGTASSVLDVYLYFDGGFDQEIAHNIVRNVDYTNVGGFVDVYYWTVPSGLSCSDLYSIYITDTGGGDSSSVQTTWIWSAGSSSYHHAIMLTYRPRPTNWWQPYEHGRGIEDSDQTSPFMSGSPL